jgi:uncharacterized protein (DUF362 family)
VYGRYGLKTNFVGERGNPTTTNPEVVKAVVELLYESGASKVYVGDMSALIRGGTAQNMEQTGIAAAARSAGAQTVFFEDHGWVKNKCDVVGLGIIKSFGQWEPLAPLSP